jgi:hypothetical protein
MLPLHHTAGGGGGAADKSLTIQMNQSPAEGGSGKGAAATAGGGSSVSGAKWLMGWLALNVSLTLLNKAVFSFGAFHFPLTLSALHMLITGALSWACVHHLKLFPYNPNIDQRGQVYLWLFSFIFSIKYVHMCHARTPHTHTRAYLARAAPPSLPLQARRVHRLEPEAAVFVARVHTHFTSRTPSLTCSRPLAWGASIVMGNVSIQVVSVALVQVFRAIIPGVRLPLPPHANTNILLLQFERACALRA